MSGQSTHDSTFPTELLTTFHIGKELFGIEMMRVQEVTGNPLISPVPLAPRFVKGLVNLRGQLATALGLRELFNASEGPAADPMSVVCRVEGNLLSLIVDDIGDVVEADRRQFEMTPDTLPKEIRKFVKGIYKMNGLLLSVLDLDSLSRELNSTADPEHPRAD